MKPTTRKGVKFLDAKVLIAALALVVTLGFWNLFSNPDLLVVRSLLPAGPDPQTAGQGLPPLPTLAPLLAVSANPAAPVAQNGAQNAPLRAVTAPEQTIVQKMKPVVDQPAPVVAVEGGSAAAGSSTSAAAPAPVTSTGSSKK